MHHVERVLYVCAHAEEGIQVILMAPGSIVVNVSCKNETISVESKLQSYCKVSQK